MPGCSLGYPLHAIFLSSGFALTVLLLALHPGPVRSIRWVLCLGGWQSIPAAQSCCVQGSFQEREDCSVNVHASLFAICPVFAALRSRGSCLSAVRGQVAEGRGSRELCHTAVPKPCHVSRLSWGGWAGALGAAAQQAVEHQCLDLSPAARASPRTVVSLAVLVSWSAWWHWWCLFGPSNVLMLMGPWEPPRLLPPSYHHGLGAARQHSRV